MKKLLFLIALLVASIAVSAQLRGSGKTVLKSFDYINFDKINLLDFDGKIEIEVGKPFAIDVTIDDNLLNLLTVIENKSNQEITLSLKGNYDNKKYIENTKIKIKISLPKLTEVTHRGNSGLTIMDYKGENLKLSNSSNGSVSIDGEVTNFVVKNAGNGNIFAEKLLSQTAKVKCSGNGNVRLRTAIEVDGDASGNCTIFNSGKGKFSASSSKSGNARLIQQ